MYMPVAISDRRLDLPLPSSPWLYVEGIQYKCVTASSQPSLASSQQLRGLKLCWAWQEVEDYRSRQLCGIHRRGNYKNIYGILTGPVEPGLIYKLKS